MSGGSPLLPDDRPSPHAHTQLHANTGGSSIAKQGCLCHLPGFCRIHTSPQTTSNEYCAATVTMRGSKDSIAAARPPHMSLQEMNHARDRPTISEPRTAPPPPSFNSHQQRSPE
ncbi:unnamed protein product, partial [Ectocarpus sp. 12 AP-2014]